jgi:hypothetical protein
MTEQEGVDVMTGEIVALAKSEPLEVGAYAGASLLILSVDEARGLEAVLPDDAHEILPTGEVYVQQVHYRRLLNKTFGPGQWALVPRGAFVKQGKTLCREYGLLVRGHFVAEAVGEIDYHENNDRMSWATAAEALKSNALTRLCKDLGIASECWDRQWTEAWKTRHAVMVWLKDSSKPQWRRRDAAPFWNEKSVDLRPATDPAPSRPPAPAVESEPKLTAAQCALLFTRAKAAGLAGKPEVYAIASKIIGAPITSAKLIPQSKFDVILAALPAGVVSQPAAAVGERAGEAEPYEPTDEDVDWLPSAEPE